MSTTTAQHVADVDVLEAYDVTEDAMPIAGIRRVRRQRGARRIATWEVKVPGSRFESWTPVAIVGAKREDVVRQAFLMHLGGTHRLADLDARIAARGGLVLA